MRTLNFPPLGTRLADKNGQPTREWRDFFRIAYEARLGGYEGTLVTGGNGITVTDGSEVAIDPSDNIDWTGRQTFRPAASVTPTVNGMMVFELTNNTTLTVRVRGSDGVTRSSVLVLA